MASRECELCRSMDPIMAHQIPHRGSFALLCTPCVLRHHTGAYCPLCFHVHDDSTASRVMCNRCPAMAHAACLRSSRYLCNQCSDSASSGGGGDWASQLLCAAKIAAVCLWKASAMARVDAEMKLRGAMLAKHKAREAIERVAYMAQSQDDDSEVDDA